MTMTSPSATRQNRHVGGRPGAAAGKDGDGQDKGQDGAGKKGLLKSKKFLIILIVVVLVGGVGAYKFAMPHKAAPPAGGEVVAMDPTTLNLAGGHYLKIAVAIQLVKGKATAAAFDSSHAAELVINEFSDRTVTSLGSNAARKKLTTQLLTAVQQAYPGEVFQIFLTQFVTQ